MTTVQEAKTILFQDSLSDVVRQMRNSRKGEQETIQEALADIRQELKSSAQHVKVTAVVKLTYFAMLGFPGDHGAFNIIEVMADQIFAHKRVGYIAAAVILNDTSPVLPLCTALLKKDLNSPNQCEASLALYCLSCVCTPDLARDLVSDVVGLLNSPRATIRKKAVLCLYKMFLQFPEALRPTYPLLKDKLEDGSDKTDNDPAVRGAVVNVLCELARRNPANFLNLVPPFYALLSSIHNNWTLIKVVKVFGYFAPLEPRLGKKLVDPLTNIITTTHAKSVQYECLLAVANGMSKVTSLTKLAIERMKVFVEDRDSNLKYLGLDAMSRILRDSPKQLIDQRDTVLTCLADRDPTIRDKALIILQGMVTKKNLVDTVNAMFDNIVLTPPDDEWSNRVIKTIVDTVAEDDYSQVTDFEWYLAVLMDLAQLQLQNFKYGELIENEFVTIVTRVNAARQYGVESLSSLLTNTTLLTSSHTGSTQWSILRAAAFICGEFPYWLVNKKQTVEQLLSDRLAHFPSSLQAVAISAISKIYAFTLRPCERHMVRRDGEEELQDPDDSTTAQDIVQVILGSGASAAPVTCAVAPLSRHHASAEQSMSLSGPLAKFCTSVDPVVQERSLLLRYMAMNPPAAGSDATYHTLFFAAEIEPVAEGAQQAVALPPGLDFDTPFCESLPTLVADSDDDDDSDSSGDDGTKMESALRAERERQTRRRTDVDAFYLKGGEDAAGGHVDPNDLPPVEQLDTRSGPSRHRVGAKKSQTISKSLSKPANYVSPQSAKPKTSDEPVDELAARLRHISVDKPIGKDEVLPTIQPYKRQEASSASPVRDTNEPDAVAAALETKRLGASRNFQVFEVIATDKASVTLQVVECKPKKDGSFDLALVAIIKNLSTSHSLYAPALTLIFEALDENTPQLINADGVAVDSVSLGERLKQEASVTTEVHIHFPCIPDLSAPLAVGLTFTEKKKATTLQGSFPVLCKYFLTPVEKIPTDEFNTTVLDSLATAGCVSVGIPIASQTDLGALLDSLRASLRLTVVDVYRDCVSLYGSIAVRKKAPAQFIAVMLKEDPCEEEGFDRQLTVAVKCGLEPLMQGIVHEVSQALGVTVA